MTLLSFMVLFRRLCWSMVPWPHKGTITSVACQLTFHRRHWPRLASRNAPLLVGRAPLRQSLTGDDRASAFAYSKRWSTRKNVWPTTWTQMEFESSQNELSSFWIVLHSVACNARVAESGVICYIYIYIYIYTDKTTLWVIRSLEVGEGANEWSKHRSNNQINILSGFSKTHFVKTWFPKLVPSTLGFMNSVSQHMVLKNRFCVGWLLTNSIPSWDALPFIYLTLSNTI